MIDDLTDEAGALTSDIVPAYVAVAPEARIVGLKRGRIRFSLVSAANDSLQRATPATGAGVLGRRSGVSRAALRSRAGLHPDCGTARRRDRGRARAAEGASRRRRHLATRALAGTGGVASRSAQDRRLAAIASRGNAIAGTSCPASG